MYLLMPACLMRWTLAASIRTILAGQNTHSKSPPFILAFFKISNIFSYDNESMCSTILLFLNIWRAGEILLAEVAWENRILSWWGWNVSSWAAYLLSNTSRAAAAAWISTKENPYSHSIKNIDFWTYMHFHSSIASHKNT